MNKSGQNLANLWKPSNHYCTIKHPKTGGNIIVIFTETKTTWEMAKQLKVTSGR